jgi:Tetratricopeptide repeat
MPPSPNRIAYYRDRCAPPLTQATLARAIGKHVNSVQLWEKRGAPSPADLLRLAALFVERGAIKDYECALGFWAISGRESFAVPPELRQLFVAAPTAPLPPTDALPPYAPLPPGSLLPLHRNPLFVGRADELLALAAALAAGDTAVVTGMGGLGKTQLAVEFAHRYGQFYSGGVFWLNFDNPTVVSVEVARCGDLGAMELRADFGGLPLDTQVALVQAAWQSPVARLLIFDNCEDEALLARWRPTTGGCRVLVTSRRAHWDAALGVRTLALKVLNRAESIALLHSYRDDLLEHSAQLDAVADALGDLPLALHLAGSFLDRYHASYTPDDYLRQLGDGATLLKHPSFVTGGFSPTGHEHHLERTFIVSYDQLDQHQSTDALALRLLGHAAHFAPGELIPRELLLASCAITDIFIAAAALARLDELGLLDPAADGALRLHRLVAAFARTISADPSAAAEVAAALCAYAEHLIDHGATGQMRAILGQMRFAVDRQLVGVASADLDAGMPAQLRDSLGQAAELCSVFGRLLMRLAAYADASPYLQRSVELSRQAGPAAATVKHLIYLANCLPRRSAAPTGVGAATVKHLIYQGHLHQYLHHLNDALSSYAEALALAKAELPADDPLLASSACHMGYALSLRGAFDEAGALLAQSLAIVERVYGPQHLETAEYLNLFGYHLVLSGAPATALAPLGRGLAIREAELGMQRPLTVQSLNNFAEALHAAGDLQAARTYHERALAGRIALFGERHHGVAESYRNLGMLALDEGDAIEARRLVELAAAICEETVGLVNRDTALAYEALGRVELAFGRRALALGHFRHALAILEGYYLPGTEPLRQLHARVAEAAK